MIKIAALIIGGGLGLLLNNMDSHLARQYEEIQDIKNIPGWFISICYAILWLLLSFNQSSIDQITFLGIIISILLFLSIFDLKYMLLPTKTIYLGIAVTLLYILQRRIVYQDVYTMITGVIGGMLGYGLFFLLFHGSKWLLNKEGLGYGDVRVMAFIGLVVGVMQLPLVILLASFLAVLTGLILYIIKAKSEPYPFGPFLCGAAIVMLIYGEPITDFYLRCMGQ